MHTDPEPLPADLAKPRRDRPKGSDLAGIITGGVLLVIIVPALIYAVTL
ncbi:membrane protein [Microbacterium phage NoodlelyBoi]|uniref:Membrane protein n=1 Tax=Microbacterium phage NoodlelyBoi TaxID=2813165 RepID=A0A899IQX3_9CAUD|nr:membrane protein [Microbacterium phage NoodlelyBoi]QSM01242.1 membrane protein [Microbacterium phage NoodlelyBoi]